MAELLTRSHTPFVASAGTHAGAGNTMHPKAIRALAEVGIDGTGFRSRQLTARLAVQADLILTATREQRAHCVRLAPWQLGRAFTIAQFGRLVHAAAISGPSDVDTLLKAITNVRGELQPVPAAQDDIADPVHGTLDDMRSCMRQIQLCLAPVLAVIEAS